MTQRPLIDGVTLQSDGRTIVYRIAHLRETTVADERWATRQAERVMHIEGRPTLLVSDADFRFAMTARHIEAFECDGQRMTQAMLGDGWLDVVGKLSSHDLGLIEQQIFLLELAAEVRYGRITPAEFEAIASGTMPVDQGTASPRSVGQVAELGQAAAEPQPGPVMLADFAGGPDHRPAAVLGG